MAAKPFRPDVSLWQAWDPSDVARRLADVRTPWYVTAGWALDLFRRRQTRAHEDLEIAVPSYGFSALREALAEFELFVIGDGVAHPVTRETLARHHQTWVRDPASGRWRLDIMREPWDGDTWVCRRDPRIRLPASRVVAHTEDDIPFAQPEIALLFKAKAARPKDDADFAAVLPLLDAARRRWLEEALALLHPGHAWLRSLAA